MEIIFLLEFYPNEEFERAHYRVALHETQQCGHPHYTWPHPFPTLDNARQKGLERNEYFFHDSITLPPITTKKIKAFADHLSEWNRTGTVTPVDKNHRGRKV